MDKRLILKGVIESYQNDFLCGYEGSDKDFYDKVILNLIVELSRFTNDIRYCSNKSCICSPEKAIGLIMESHKERLEQLIFSQHGLTEINMPKAFDFLIEVGGQ